MNLSQDMLRLGKKSSVIREIFEYSKRRKAQIGAERVFDFSIGNPSVPAPAALSETMQRLLRERDPVLLHGYTAAAGDPEVRQRLAEGINRAHNAQVKGELIYMTCGAAASLTISLTAMMEPGDEVIVLAPFFPEYRVFVQHAGGKLVVVPCRERDFQIDFERLAQAITPHTKAVIINSPNNPTGVIIPEGDLIRLADLLTEKRREFGRTIYLISDEPYRKLVWNGQKVPFVPHYYADTLVCYSFSKAVSLPGERIGYILVPPAMQGAEDLFAAICGAGRALGFVCAPSLLQFAIAECADLTADFSIYRTNRSLLLDGLSEIGYELIPPDGAFYLFMKALEKDAYAFCQRAKQYELLLVPSDDFGCTGFVRIAYCVTTAQIQAALPAFRQLYQDYKGNEKT